MSNPINFESIQPWNGAAGTGKDARNLLDRNFQKTKEKFVDLDDNKADKTTGFFYLGPAEISAMPGIFGPNDRVYYSMLVPKEVPDLPNFNIHEITLNVDTIFLLTWIGDCWSVAVFPLPEGSTVADGAVTPGKIASEIVQQDPDWMDIFTKEGHWIFIDDEHSVNRPDGLPDPTVDGYIPYRIITLGLSDTSKPACLAIADRAGEKFYFLVKGDDDVVSVNEVASHSYVDGLIGDINTILDYINGEVL